jgi:hypothetical protein
LLLVSDRWRWRPEPWWLGAGLLLGAAAGVPVGALWGMLLFALPGEPLVGLAVGGSFGLMYGAFVGLGVGALLAVVVGRDRPLPSARRLATLGGLLATPVLVVGLLAARGLAVNSWAVPLLVMSALAGALSCRWVAGKMPDRPRVVRR